MAIPTPAQIEAAAREINIDGHYMDYFAHDLAFKALTAAAEVGERQPEISPRMVSLVERDRAAIIEDCAQVVESLLTGRYFAGLRREIATAIRKLKDE